MKTIFKVMYIAFAVVVGIIVGFGTYVSYTYDYIYEQTNNYLNEKNYTDLASMYSYWYEKENIAPENSCDKYQIGILRGGITEAYTYYETEEEQKANSRATACYYLYISNIKFDRSNCSIGNDYTNLSGIRFYSGTDTYDYLFIISEDVNKTLYKAKPSSELEAIRTSRNLLTTLDTWNFIDLQITPKIVEAMGFTGTIDGFEIIDNSGEVVGDKLTVNFDFNGEFFTFFDEFVTKYDQYLDAINEAGDDSAKKEQANTIFSEFYDKEGGYKDQLVQKGYGINLYTNPSSLIWKAIGIVAIFAVAVVLLYMLIFHFKWLKGLFIKENKNNRYRVSNKQIAEMEAKKNGTVKADFKEIRAKTEEEKKAEAEQASEEKTK